MDRTQAAQHWVKPLTKIQALIVPFAVFGQAVSLLLSPATAAEHMSELCDVAARDAAQAFGVPLDVLLAITRAETGRSYSGAVAPWPWAANRAGRGHWFPTKGEAVAAVQTAIDGGERNIDIGCFQINLHWHSSAFASLEEMFDPRVNAEYAARFLADLKSESGDWATAIGAFHSRRPDDATRYIEKVEVVMADLGAAPSVALGASRPRENRFPLLQAGGLGRLGSLVAAPESSEIVPLIQ